MVFSYISTDTIYLGEGDEEFVSLGIVEFEVFSFYLSESFLHYRVKKCDTMFTVHDKVSWLESEEEIKVFCDGFFDSFFYKNLPKYIIRDDKVLTIFICPESTHELR